MKDPAVLFYTSDFITGTITMTDEQVGKYIRLLCLQHQKGRLTEKDMLFICKSYDEDIFTKFDKNGDGRYFNQRMENEITKRSKYSESRANNRKNSNKIKKNTSFSSSHMINICKTYDEHMENENENIIIDEFKEGGAGETINFQNTIDYWNTNTKFVKITEITNERKAAILFLIKKHGKEALRTVIDNVSKSGYLNGKNDKGWKITFDWILKPANFLKILEGNYDNSYMKKREIIYNM